MFNPLGAFSSFGQGAVQGFSDPHIMDMLGRMALGRALQQPDQPMAPPPGQASMPMQPPMQQPPMQPQGGGMAQQPQMPQDMGGQGPRPGGMQGNLSDEPLISISRQGSPDSAFGAIQARSQPQQQMPPQGQGMPGGGMPSQFTPAMQQARDDQRMPNMQQTPQGLMPQLDLPTMIQRIRSANPNIPPAAMAAALGHALPLLNTQAKYEAMQLRNELLTMRENNLNWRTGQNIQSRENIAGQNIQSRENIAGQNNETRTNIATGHDTTRTNIATNAEAGRQQRFSQTYERLTANARTRFDQAERRLQQTIDSANTREGRLAAGQQLRLMEQEALAAHRAATEKTNAGFLPNAKAAAALKEEADQHLRETQARIQAYKEKLNQGGQPPAQGALQAPGGSSQGQQPGDHVNPQTGQVIFFDPKQNAWVDRATGQPVK